MSGKERPSLPFEPEKEGEIPGKDWSMTKNDIVLWLRAAL